MLVRGISHPLNVRKHHSLFVMQEMHDLFFLAHTTHKLPMHTPQDAQSVVNTVVLISSNSAYTPSLDPAPFLHLQGGVLLPCVCKKGLGGG